MTDTTEKLSSLESRVKAYLEERYPRGYRIESHVEFLPCHLRLGVRHPDGERGPTLIIPEEFADLAEEIEREFDARNVMGAMARAGKGNVIVPMVGPPVIEPAE